MKETERIKAVADADRLKDVQAIDISKHIEQEEGKANISSIRNEIMAKKRVRIFNSIFNVFNNIEKKIWYNDVSYLNVRFISNDSE